MEVDFELGCTWGMQKAAIICSINDLNDSICKRIEIKSFMSIVEGTYKDLPADFKSKIDSKLQSVIERKINAFENSIRKIKTMKESGGSTRLQQDPSTRSRRFSSSNNSFPSDMSPTAINMATQLCQIQADFLRKLLDENKQLYNLLDSKDLEVTDDEIIQEQLAKDLTQNDENTSCNRLIRRDVKS